MPSKEELSAEDRQLVGLCELSFSTLAKYYTFAPSPFDFASFLLPASPVLGLAGEVLVEECAAAGEVFLGVRFGEAIYKMAQNSPRDPLLLGIIAEETSHLVTLAEAAQSERKISHLSLEVLGEIDRFIVLLHAAEVSLADLCDYLFEGQRFAQNLPLEKLEMYVKAEELAFLHLREAFRQNWTDWAFPWGEAHKPAANYLSALRESLLVKAA